MKKIKPYEIVLCIFEYLFIGSIVLGGSSMYSFTINHSFSESAFRKVSIILAFAIIIIMMLEKIKPKINTDDLFWIISFIVFNIIYAFVTNYKVKSFIINYMMVVYVYSVMIVFYRNIPGGCRRLIDKFSNFVLLISIGSLFFYIFGTILDILPGASKVRYSKMDINFTCKTYYNLYFEAQTQKIFGKEFIRNSACFLEAPGFSLPITLILVYEMYGRKTIDKFKVCIFTITGITTFSTKAIIIFALIYGLYFVFDLKIRNAVLALLKKFIVPVIISVISIVILIAVSVKVNENAGSFLGRMDSLQACLKAWMKNPIFGNGFKNDDIIRSYYGYIKSKANGITAGMFCVLAQGGIWLFSQYIYCLFNLYKKAENRKLVKVFILVFIILWFQSSIQFNTKMYFVLAMGMVGPVVKQNEIKEKLCLIGHRA